MELTWVIKVTYLSSRGNKGNRHNMGNRSNICTKGNMDHRIDMGNEGYKGAQFI